MEIIERNVRIQEQLVSDLLDMSRIISGKFWLDFKKIQLQGVIESALDSVRQAATAKGVGLETEIDLESKDILADPNRLHQVVWNLISNAIKFTPKGGRVQLTARSVNSNAEIKIQDTGIGIKPEFLPHVFDRFRQADASFTRHEGGLGLGLAIVRHMVEAHRGTVRAESLGENKGATFSVVLPENVTQLEEHQAGSPEAATVPSDSAGVQGLKILVIDDDPEARALIRRQLADLQAVVHLAGSAAEGVREFTKFRPDVIVCDIGMPGQNGYEFIKEIRALEQDRGETPAIALTAFARSEDRERAIAAGFQVHLSKPIGSDRLAAAISGVAPAAHRTVLSTRPGEKKADSLRILIVEDNEDTALYIATALQQQGHQVTVARDGPSALETAAAFQPGAILLDLGLPGMDGYEVARRLRRTNGLEGIPVAAVTGYAAGSKGNDTSLFDYYVNKPIWPEKLYALIDDLRLRASKKIFALPQSRLVTLPTSRQHTEAATGNTLGRA